MFCDTNYTFYIVQMVQYIGQPKFHWSFFLHQNITHFLKTVQLVRFLFSSCIVCFVFLLCQHRAPMKKVRKSLALDAVDCPVVPKSRRKSLRTEIRKSTMVRAKSFYPHQPPQNPERNIHIQELVFFIIKVTITHDFLFVLLFFLVYVA